jgi:hypothetical protein
MLSVHSLNKDVHAICELVVSDMLCWLLTLLLIESNFSTDILGDSNLKVVILFILIW